MPFVRVAVNHPSIPGEYDYSLPPELSAQARPGCLLTVPLGGQVMQGVLLAFVETPAMEDVKPVQDVIDPRPVMTEEQIALARWMAQANLQPLSAIISLFLPPGLAQQADVLYRLAEGFSPASFNGPTEKRLLELLQTRGPLRGRQIDRHFPDAEWRKTAQKLARQGYLKSQSVLPSPTMRPKFIRMAQLAAPPAEAEDFIGQLAENETQRNRQKNQRLTLALQMLIHEPDAVNVTWVYAESSCKLDDLQELEEAGLIRLFESEIFRDSLAGIRPLENDTVTDFELSPEQQQAMQALGLPGGNPILLHGVTGSGKTEIYLRAAEEVVRAGGQALILVPEIALTPQTVRRFLARFPGQVGLLHSRLSDGERYDTWRRARAGLLKVVIGPRSALFTPFQNIGLIVLDECHDSSYRQSEPPFYSAVEAAIQYARFCGATCLLGSATPTVEQRYRAETGQFTLLELPNRVAGGQPLPQVSLVDMREELKAGNRGIFSRELQEVLAETLQRGEQAILYLNRRGAATHVFCRDCGHVVQCPRCDSPLTLHETGGQALLCHTCGYTRKQPKTCPNCNSEQIRAYGLGSEKVESEVQSLLPNARILRWDWDTTRKKDAHEIILTHFANHQADVLVGTQMLAKGLDLPMVTLVGIVLADVGLSLPDPFAAEKNFQLLTQVAGRAGRSARGGRVVMQTFMPEHPVIQMAARHDFAGFYAAELASRRELGYPPFMNLLRLEIRHRNGEQVRALADSLAQQLESRIHAESARQTTIIGPAPCYFQKMNDLFRWQVVLRGPNPAVLIDGLRLDGWRVEVNPGSLL